MSAAEIMVVEDEGITAKDLEAQLTRLGYSVGAVANSGEEALAQAARQRPDLVLMDIKLKGAMDGIQAAEELRRRFNIPVAYLTAFADEATLARAQRTGPYGYILKPFQERELHATIQMALQRHRLESEVEESKRWLSTLLGAVRDGIVATDRDGFVRFMNSVAETTTGWAQEEALGRELSTVFRTVPLERDRAQAYHRLGDTHLVELISRGDKKTPIEVSTATATDPEGQITGFVWAFRDVSSRRLAEQELREREEHFRSLIEGASDIITVLDQDGTIYYASPSVERILGYSPADILGNNALENLHPGDVAAAARALSGVGGANAGGMIEIRVRDNRGVWRVLEAASSRRFEDAEGQRIVVNARDVTARREMEAKLKDELTLSEALAQVGEAMIGGLGSRDLLERLCRVTAEVLNCDFSHTWFREPDEQVYLTVAGYGDSGELWESMRALRVPRPVIGRLVDRLQQQGIAEVVMTGGEELLPRALPTKYGITLAMYIALHRGGDLVGIQTAGYRGRVEPFSPLQKRIAAGIGRLASLVLEHVRLLDEVERASRMKSDMMATLSHELRNPLATIVSLTELLAKASSTPLAPADLERVAAIRRTSQQMLELVQTTVDFNRFERQRTPIDLRDLRPADLLAEIKAEVVHLPRQPDVQLAWDMGSGLPVLRTDRTKLKVIVKNLIGNALKFTDSGTVSVKVSPADGGVEFAVTDTGAGIPPESASVVFEPFRQLEPSSPTSGVGLGLYIARQLTDLLGGRLEMESAVGRGSTFRVWIPIGR